MTGQLDVERNAKNNIKLHSPKIEKRLFSAKSRTHMEVGTYLSAEKQSVYSTALANYAKIRLRRSFNDNEIPI